MGAMGATFEKGEFFNLYLSREVLLRKQDILSNTLLCIHAVT